MHSRAYERFKKYEAWEKQFKYNISSVKKTGLAVTKLNTKTSFLKQKEIEPDQFDQEILHFIIGIITPPPILEHKFFH